jgi:hypothetical protein
MADLKEESVTTTQLAMDAEIASENVSPEKKGTASDQWDMFRMGKHQQLRV